MPRVHANFGTWVSVWLGYEAPPATRSKRKKFKAHPLGQFHVGIAGVQPAEGKLYLCLAITHGLVTMANTILKTGLPR